ncbi:MAG: ral secretion pathway protein [Betaproteobacteria bacterium]|jgi:general secretion pathway protein D|nr:ral secretion pathway protein [Betaproteobacteria bacterium]
MRKTSTVFAALLLCACAQNLAYREGLDLIEAGKTEAGLAKLDEATRRDPQNREYRQALIRQRETALQRYLSLAESARQQGQWDAAEEIYRRMLAIDPNYARARAGLEAVGMERRHRSELAAADDLLKKGNAGGAAAMTRRVLIENPGNRDARDLLRRIEERALRAEATPQLSAALRQPITLDFRDATLRQIFEAISRGSGLNFIFDRDVRQDARTTIFVRNSSIEDVLRFVLVTNQLERKVLSENTVLVYPSTPAKLRDYQELVVKSFYLSNADVKATANMIRTLVKTKDLYIDEKLNLLVIRDTADAVRMAERLVANQDLAEPEVMLEVEVLEVGTNTLQALGIGWPNSFSVGVVGAGGTPGVITLREWQNRSSELVRLTFTDPLLALNFRNTIDRSNLLANPRIRVKNKDKAKIHIGDKVPVITTTTTSTGFAAESVTYLEVGLKLEVEPAISLGDEVGIKIGLEVSNVAREIRSATGTLTYQIGTRNAATSLRLKDGETQVLAGLISDEDRKNVNQIPGLGDLPLLGRLFGTHQDTRNKTEIVLLITPRVVRNLARPEPRFEEFPSGTEAAIGAPALYLQQSTLEPASPAAVASATRVSLVAPAAIPTGGEFTVQVALESEGALRGGLIDFGYDRARLRFVRAEPGSLLDGASFRANAPEGLGRLNISFTANGGVKGRGELARLTFQALEGAAHPSQVKIEAASLTDSKGQLVPLAR